MTLATIYKSALTLLFPISLTACSNTADEDVAPVHNTAFLIDLTDSFALLKSPEYAATIAMDTAPAFEELGEFSKVTLRTFGEYGIVDSPSNSLVVTKVIGKNYRPDAAQKEITSLILSIPPQVASGAIVPQGSTNIIAALEDLSRRVKCNSETVWDAVLVTDGNEQSTVSVGEIPAPASPIFQGCGTLHILGLTGNDPAHTRKLSLAWTAFAKAAGFADVRIVR